MFVKKSKLIIEWLSSREKSILLNNTIKEYNKNYYSNKKTMLTIDGRTYILKSCMKDD